jgi:hypothetical protein
MAGRPKEFDGIIKTPTTQAQRRHLEMRAVAANDSVAAVVRHLIDQDMRRVKEGKHGR